MRPTVIDFDQTWAHTSAILPAGAPDSPAEPDVECFMSEGALAQIQALRAEDPEMEGRDGLLPERFSSITATVQMVREAGVWKIHQQSFASSGRGLFGN